MRRPLCWSAVSYTHLDVYKRQVVELCKQERSANSPYLVVHGNNLEQAGKLLEACRQELGCEPALEYLIGGVVSINAGPNVIGLVYRT